MDYEFFYDLAVYSSENWRGKFTYKEIACYAHEWWLSWQECCKNKKLNHDIQTLVENLEEDQENVFLNTIKLEMRRW